MHTSPTSYIGDYLPIKTLGVGATGKVKLARHLHTGQYVALKIIRKNLLDAQFTLHQKVRREIAVMKFIAGNSRNIFYTQSNQSPSPSDVGVLNLLDVYDTDLHFVLVLQFCEGGELFDLLVEQGHFPLHQVLDYFQQIVYALEFCHNRGICHRDLKPENILLTADGRIKLADFGMSSLLTPGTFLETSCGSPQYCAPEVIMGAQYDGCTADIWSLGVTLYAMTTGGLPFDDENLHGLINKIQSGTFYMPSEVPDDLAHLISIMLVTDPAKRATIEDIKRSPWFKSSPCRHDIFIDDKLELHKLWLKVADKPIVKPQPTILRYLADLGLGDIPTIRRRISSSDRCVERDIYYQLAEFCQHSLSFKHVDNVPPSPSVSQDISPQGTPPETSTIETVVEKRIFNTTPKPISNDAFESNIGMSPPSIAIPVEQNWFPHWALAFASEGGHGSVTNSAVQIQHHQTAPQVLPSVSSR